MRVDTSTGPVRAEIGDVVSVRIPFRNGAGELERRSVRGRVFETTGGAMDPLWISVEVTDGVEGEPIVIQVNATRVRVTVRERGGE